MLDFQGADAKARAETKSQPGKHLRATKKQTDTPAGASKEEIGKTEAELQMKLILEDEANVWV